MSEATRDKDQTFPGFFELKTAEDMLEKAKRELARLEAEESIDHVYNFFVTAYHIVDYLDGRLSKREVEDIFKDPSMQFCADVCNKAKHMRLEPSKQPKNKKRPDVPTFSRFMGALFNSGASYNTFAYNECRVERLIYWENEKPKQCLEVVGLARDVIAKWDKILADPDLRGAEMISVRKARVEEAERVLDVLKDAKFLKPEYRTGEKLSKMRDICGQGAIWIAQQNGQVVSAIMATFIGVPQLRIYCEIPILVTRPEFRRRGLARRLLREVMAEAAALDVVSITAYAENEKSAYLLKSEGFCAVEDCVDKHNNQKYELRRQSPT